MKIRHSMMTLSDTTPVQIPQDFGDAVQYTVSFSLQNIDEEAIIYIGDQSVSSSSFGVKLIPGATASFEGVSRVSGLYAISSVDESVGAVLRMSL